MKRAIPLLVLAVVLSSCTIRFDSNTTVNEDGSGTLALEISFDEEFRQFMDDTGDASFDITGDLQDVPAGWSATEFSRDGFEGIRIGVDFGDLAELDQRLAELNEAAGEEQATPIFIEQSGLSRNGSGFDFELTIAGLEEGLTDASGSAGGDDLGFEGLDPAALFGDVFEIRYVLTLPGEITSHNADAVEGSTLTWNIGLSDDGRLLAATSGGGGGGSLTLILGVLALLALAILAFVVIRVRKRRPQHQSTHDQPIDQVPAGIVSGDPFAAPAQEGLETD